MPLKFSPWDGDGVSRNGNGRWHGWPGDKLILSVATVFLYYNRGAYTRLVRRGGMGRDILGPGIGPNGPVQGPHIRVHGAPIWSLRGARGLILLARLFARLMVRNADTPKRAKQ